ncbi:MAG: RNA methyltransferase [Flavobacteriaceae bacterium]|nr:RNA methyltransferase [Flavobacteriaceae bacterium]
MRKLKTHELQRISPQAYQTAHKSDIALVLNNIRSAHNTGSIFRTADAFRVHHLFLCGHTPTPPHKEIHKTALGATDNIAWTYHKDALSCVQQLKTQGYFIAAVEQTDSSLELPQFKPAKDQKIAIVVGNEVEGVDLEILKLANVVLEIPQYGTKHSFNVSVCTGMVLYDVFFKLGGIR